MNAGARYQPLDLLRVAVLGTAQVPEPSADEASTPVAELVRQLPGADRQRDLLLTAAGYALLKRTSPPPFAAAAAGPPSAPETLNSPQPRLRGLLVQLFAEGEWELLSEALIRMREAGIRLPDELLPAALSVTQAEFREAVRPLLGQRGHWLASHKPEWTWPLTDSEAATTSPAELEARFQDANAAERKALFLTARRSSPELSRAWLASYWKQEKADQRLAWLEGLSSRLEPEDEPVLQGMLSDRSAPVRITAARLCWRLPESALALRLRARADALLLDFSTAAGLQVILPPEEFDPQLEREGITEAPPQGVGRRQWWLTQILSATSPEHWRRRFGAGPSELLAAIQAHELKGALLDGLTTAALRHDAQLWFAPLWDAAVGSGALGPASNYRLTPDPIAALSPRLDAQASEPRMLALLEAGSSQRLQHFPRPWPPAFSQGFLAALASYQPSLMALLPIAAVAIGLDDLPQQLIVPDVPENQYAVQAYLRALDQFQAVVATRRVIAQETLLHPAQETQP